MSAVSSNYRELLPSEVATIAAELVAAWQDPAIPERQYLTAVKSELENYRKGGTCAPFDTLVRCLERLPVEMNSSLTHLLDVGASGGYYSEVLSLKGFRYDYTGLDFSEGFRSLAKELYPGIRFQLGDARNLPYPSGTFDIVLNGAQLMHCLEYERVISEMTRVAKDFLIFHRTPVLTQKPTAWFVKSAYDVQCIEVHFNEQELLKLFAKYGLTVIWVDDVFFDFAQSFGHRDYVVRKDTAMHHPV